MKDYSKLIVGLDDYKLEDSNKHFTEYIGNTICPCKTIPFNKVTSTGADDSGGFKSGHLWLIGGQTSAGKTQWSLNEALNANYKYGKNVLYISTEMTKVDIVSRTKYDQGQFDTLIVDDYTEMAEILVMFNQLLKLNKYDIIFYDYINPVLIGTNEGFVGEDKITPLAPKNCPDDQKIVILLGWLRKMIQAEAFEKHPNLIVMTQLNRMAASEIPDSNVVQGSASSANRCDLAANIVFSNENEREQFQSCDRILYFYKNRIPNGVYKYLCGLRYDFKSSTFNTVGLGITNEINWKELRKGRK